MRTAFDSWTQGREVQTLGTNFGAEKLPFQSWRHFKEAFAPELIRRAATESRRPVHRCIDPFGGSGTTALACQFLGIEPVTIEVNPYLADLIEAKLSQYDSVALMRDFSSVLRSAKATKKAIPLGHLPVTFIEPGLKGRWIFSQEVSQRFAGYLQAATKLDNPLHQRFFRAILGGIAIDVSNVYVNGKGRRYRNNWEVRQQSATDVDSLFCERVQNALCEIVRFSSRPEERYTLLRGDAKRMLDKAPGVDLAVFSPPYPNSFDYTDIYNVELWMLGYLSSSEDNQRLRRSTLASHVSISRTYGAMPDGSKLLRNVSRNLHNIESSLWCKWIPSMVDGYFADMLEILNLLHKKLRKKGEIWAVVGDSLYAGVHVPVAKILAELSVSHGYDCVGMESFRSMRSSAQQGGKHELEETLIILRKR